MVPKKSRNFKCLSVCDILFPFGFILRYIQENYSKIRDVERELANLSLELKLTTGSKNAGCFSILQNFLPLSGRDQLYPVGISCTQWYIITYLLTNRIGWVHNWVQLIRTESPPTLLPISKIFSLLSKRVFPSHASFNFQVFFSSSKITPPVHSSSPTLLLPLAASFVINVNHYEWNIHNWAENGFDSFSEPV